MEDQAPRKVQPTLLLGLFFALVVVCGIFFGLGYTLGRSTVSSGLTAEAASPAPASNAAKPKPGNAAASEAAPSPANDLTFYKTVEQKDATPRLTPAAESNSAPSAGAPASAPVPGPSSEARATYVVQVAAVTKKEDAEALMAALRKKSYPVFVTGNAPADTLFHVQVGPFNEIKDAESTRTKLASDGYNPIVKR